MGRNQTDLPWGHCFKEPGTSQPAEIKLRQVGVGRFELDSGLQYTGATDVEVPTKTVEPILATDLTSVPGPLRWFVSPYGLHTPAALLHDRLVGNEAPAGMRRSDADRLFRHMLDCLGVPVLRRWLMWSAVAFGTRWAARGLSRVAIVVWTALAIAGMSALVVGIAVHSPGLVVAAILVPIPSAALWGRQYGGGLVAAACGA